MNNYADYTEQELIELYEERCAIREYDGGMSRRDAEQAAYFDWRELVGRSVVAPQYVQERARKFGKEVGQR